MPVVSSNSLRGVLVVVGLVVSACGSGSTATTTAPVSTSAPAPPSTTVATTTTTTSTTTTPAPAVPDGVPPEAFALVGAPMPDVDLRFEEPSDDTAKRWVEQWAIWNRWMSANPSVDPDVLGFGLVPGSEFYETALDSYSELIRTGGLLIAGRVEVLSAEAGTESFEQGAMFVVASTRRASAGYRLEQGVLVDVIEADGAATAVTIHLVIRDGGDGLWRLEKLERP